MEKTGGGNDIFVAWKGGRSDRRLHAIWDGTLAFEGNLARVEDVRAVWQSIDDVLRGSWQPIDLNRWANDSFQLARRYAYRDLGPSQPIVNGATIDDEYELTARPIRDGPSFKKRRFVWLG